MRPEFGQVMVMQAEGECIPDDEILAQPFQFQNPQVRLLLRHWSSAVMKGRPPQRHLGRKQTVGECAASIPSALTESQDRGSRPPNLRRKVVETDSSARRSITVSERSGN